MMGNSKAKPEQSDSKETPNPTESIYPQLQIRNCVRNVRNNNGNFSDMYPNEAGTSYGQANRSSVYTIDVPGSTPSNFTNAAFVSTEGATKTGQPNDGLPSYEEAIGGVKNPNAMPIAPATPSAPALSTVQPSVDVVNEQNSNGQSSSGRRHRHRRRHRGHQNTDKSNENSQSDQAPEEHRRHRHRRGFRLKRHLDKYRKNTETD